jgi:hypothetical protein
MSKKKAQMMQDLADLNSAVGMKQGVKGDIDLSDIDQNQAETIMTMFGKDTDNVWSKEDVQEFMNEYHRGETLLEFLKE